MRYKKMKTIMKKQMKFMEEKKTATKSDKNLIEYCCLCGAQTEYRFDEPVQERENYIAGVGQLCPKCARNLAKESYGTYVEDC